MNPFLKEQMDFTGFGTSIWQTREASFSEIREMMLDLVLSVTYPVPNHPAPEMLRGIYFGDMFFYGGDDERRWDVLCNLLNEGILIDIDNYISVHPARAREAMDIAGVYFGDEEPPEGTESLELAPEIREMIDLNGFEDTAEYLLAQVTAPSPAALA
tara:strand:- start:1014 stop:1484 length:471 start_codon:yes stop_codon:yes gene_type:complete